LILLTAVHYFCVGWKTDEANSPLVYSARFPKVGVPSFCVYAYIFPCGLIPVGGKFSWKISVHSSTHVYYLKLKSNVLLGKLFLSYLDG